MHTPARILIVDDSEANRQILVTRMSKHGYEILQAADGEEALASASQHRSAQAKQDHGPQS
jgi:adenylate cyclase